MEFDKNLIEKSLKIWNFNVKQLDTEKNTTCTNA